MQVGSGDLHSVPLSVYPHPPVNFWMAEPIFMRLGMHIMAPDSISTVYFIWPSNQSVCLYVYLPIVARQHWPRGLMLFRIHEPQSRMSLVARMCICRLYCCLGADPSVGRALTNQFHGTQPAGFILLLLLEKCLAFYGTRRLLQCSQEHVTECWHIIARYSNFFSSHWRLQNTFTVVDLVRRNQHSWSH
jgi:hypothetical protein